MIAPLLAALGAYDCRWPPYASHIAFELWSKPPQYDSNISNDTNGAGNGSRNTNGRRHKTRDRRHRRALLEEGGDVGREQGGVGGRDTSGDGDRLSPTDESGLVMEGGGVERGWDHRKSQEEGDEAEARDGEDDVYVRVTFNGKPITHRITDCREVDSADEGVQRWVR